MVYFSDSNKKMISSHNFLQILDNFDATTITKLQLQKLKKLGVQKISADQVTSVSCAATSLHCWMLHQISAAMDNANATEKKSIPTEFNDTLVAGL